MQLLVTYGDIRQFIFPFNSAPFTQNEKPHRNQSAKINSLLKKTMWYIDILHLSLPYLFNKLLTKKKKQVKCSFLYDFLSNITLIPLTT